MRNTRIRMAIYKNRLVRCIYMMSLLIILLTLLPRIGNVSWIGSDKVAPNTTLTSQTQRLAEFTQTINPTKGISGNKFSLGYKESCKGKIHHIAFMKVHKSASSTITNIIQRVGLNENTTFLLPIGPTYIGKMQSISYRNILPPPRGKSFEILCNHVVYNRIKFKMFLPNDTQYVAILRKPFDQFVSAFLYYKTFFEVEYLERVQGDNFISTYLQNPRRYEPANAGLSFTNNRMSYDMGIPQEYFNNNEEIDRFIANIDKQFSMVLIMEYFDESLIILRRKFCWQMKDILYIRRNVFENKPLVNITNLDKTRHRQWATSDYKLYGFFLDKLLKILSEQTDDFFAELEVFKNYLKLARGFCYSLMERILKPGETESFVFNASRWNEAFSIDIEDCKLMTMNEIMLTNHVKRFQYNGHIPILHRRRTNVIHYNGG